MTIYCENCKNVFSADHIKKRFVIDRETNFISRESRCPFCLSEELREINICKCGKVFIGKEKFCKKCIAKLKNEFFEFLQKYSVDEQEVMLCE